MLKSGNEDSGCNGGGKRFVVRADEKLTAFMRLNHVACVIVKASHSIVAAPKRIGLRSNRRLSGVLVKVLSVTSPDVSTHLRPG